MATRGRALYGVRYRNDASGHNITVDSTRVRPRHIPHRVRGHGRVSGVVRCPLTVNVNKAPQSITFDGIADQVYGAGPLTLTATATSNELSASRSYRVPRRCRAINSTLTGSARSPSKPASREQPVPTGPERYPSVRRHRGNPALSVTGGTFTYDGLGHPASGTATEASRKISELSRSRTTAQQTCR